MTVLGLMSGTSFDGLDLCCATFNKEQTGYQYQIIDAYTQEYPAEFVAQLAQAHLMNEQALGALESTYDAIALKALSTFCKRLSVSVDLLSSHGHTIFHQPEKGITRQIGDGRRYYDELKIPVVYDFRSYDVALGGQGAPLVPIGDALLFNDYDACLNLGGIANISYTENSKRLAFDIGMFNTPINDLVQAMHLPYDKDGKVAASGRVIPKLLEQLNALPFFEQPAPKSLGKEWYHEAFLSLLSSYNANTEDLTRTVTEHVVSQVSKVLNRSIDSEKHARVLITGGGAHNSFAIKRMRDMVREHITLHRPEKQLVDYKEALIFAFMGYLRSRNEINVYRSVTGASKDSCAGTFIGGTDKLNLNSK